LRPMLRRLKSFEYLEATTLEEAISFLEGQKEEAKILAGGTDLLVNMKRGKCIPSCVINIKPISGLDSISYDDVSGLSIGALTTIRAIEFSEIVAKGYPILSQAARSLGSKQIRNRATLGGNLCNASPAADMAPALIGLKATVDLVGPGGARSLLAEDLFKGPGMTALGEGEILTRVRIPHPRGNTFGRYKKLTVRRYVELAIVGVGVVLEINSDEKVCSDSRIVLGAVAPTPIRARRSEALMKGKRLDEKLIKEVGMSASEEASPITDVRASAEFRREVIPVLVGETVREALGRWV
jgi:CO/xanthine dehydrogenase FAD-binding subunit